MKHTYRYDLVDGHIIVRDGVSRLLIDTGAPSSVAETASLSFAGKTHDAAQDYMGVTPDSLSSNVGAPIHALIGADILNQYDMTADGREQSIRLTDEEEPLIGEALPLDAFMGIPILSASVQGQPVRMFFDTGAKLSYLDPGMAARFPKDGTEQDFYPGLGKFQTDTFTVPVSLGSEEIVFRVGVLPQLLQMTLMMADTAGIIGTAILDRHMICFAPRRNVLMLVRTKT
jgi:hypothetical protein